MTDEITARTRLLAYYEDRVVLLAEKVTAFEAEVAAQPGHTRVRYLESHIRRLGGETRSLLEKIDRLREALAVTQAR